jgi:hypothetical protein
VDEQPVIVSYTVVDVMSALDKMQVLLQREGMRPVGASLNPTALGEIKAQSDDHTFAIYLEVPEEQLDSLMKELPVLFEEPEPASPPPPAEAPEPATGKQSADRDAQESAQTNSGAVADARADEGKKESKGDPIGPDEAFQVVTPVDEALRQRLNLPQEAPPSKSYGPAGYPLRAPAATSETSPRAERTSTEMKRAPKSQLLPSRRSILILLPEQK